MGRWARRSPTCARSSFPPTACRPAGSELRPLPGLRPTARQVSSSSRVLFRAPCSKPFGRRPTVGRGGTLEPSDHPRFRQRARSTTRMRASNRLPRGGRYAADRCCRADVDLRPSRRPFPRTVVWRRPSGFRRCGRNGGRRPAADVVLSRTAAASGWRGRAFRGQFQPRPTLPASIPAASHLRRQACASAARFRGRRPQPPVSPSVWASACASLRVDRSCHD